MKKISALSKRPGCPPRHVWVSNNLEAMGKIADEFEAMREQDGYEYAEEKLRQRASQVSGIDIHYQHESEIEAWKKMITGKEAAE